MKMRVCCFSSFYKCQFLDSAQIFACTEDRLQVQHCCPWDFLMSYILSVDVNWAYVSEIFSLKPLHLALPSTSFEICVAYKSLNVIFWKTSLCTLSLQWLSFQISFPIWNDDNVLPCPSVIDCISSCRNLGCNTASCLLCAQNPNRRCNRTFSPKYLAGDVLKAHCGASIKVSVEDRCTLEPAEPDKLSDINLEVSWNLH